VRPPLPRCLPFGAPPPKCALRVRRTLTTLGPTTSSRSRGPWLAGRGDADTGASGSSTSGASAPRPSPTPTPQGRRAGCRRAPGRRCGSSEPSRSWQPRRHLRDAPLRRRHRRSRARRAASRRAGARDGDRDEAACLRSRVGGRSTTSASRKLLAADGLDFAAITCATCAATARTCFGAGGEVLTEKAITGSGACRGCRRGTSAIEGHPSKARAGPVPLDAALARLASPDRDGPARGER